LNNEQNANPKKKFNVRYPGISIPKNFVKFFYLYISFIEVEDLPEMKNNFRGFRQSAAGRTAKSTRKYIN
jgi:hypothetical protein